jgi:hypothetical protein
MRKSYRFEKLKSAAVSQFLCSTERHSGISLDIAVAAIIERNLVQKAPTDKPGKTLVEIYDQLREDIVKVIDAWDVRCAATLIEKFPGIVRKQDNGKSPAVDMDDKGHWVVTFD